MQVALSPSTVPEHIGNEKWSLYTEAHVTGRRAF
jgi:hypothetical protein